jgi:hypothetical protein
LVFNAPHALPRFDAKGQVIVAAAKRAGHALIGEAYAQ